MEKQAIVITYEGEKPSYEQAAIVIAALQKVGVCINAEVNPTVTSLTEEQQAEAVFAYAMREQKKGKGVTVKIQNGKPPINCTPAQAKQLISVLQSIFDL